MADVIGAIRDKWLMLGGEKGFGAALDIERPTADGQGRAQEFAGGKTVSWHPQIGAFAVEGAIHAKWVEKGREAFGYPLTDELPCPDGRGRFNHFRTMQVAGTPDASVYWTPRTGAHEIHGAIRAKWASVGWEASKLGYPRSDEHDFPAGGNGARRSDFQHGWIGWTARGGPKVNLDVAFDDGP